MKLTMYSLYDSAAEAYMRPFFFLTDGQAIRSFEDICMDATHEVAKHPECYSLWKIGYFQDNNATLIQNESISCLSRAHEVIAQKRKVDKEQLDAFEAGLNGGKDPYNTLDSMDLGE